MRWCRFKYGPIQIDICTREKSSSFFNFQSMLLVGENHTGTSTSTYANNKMLYTEVDRPRGRGGRGGSAHNDGGRYEKNHRHKMIENGILAITKVQTQTEKQNIREIRHEILTWKTIKGKNH